MNDDTPQFPLSPLYVAAHLLLNHARPYLRYKSVRYAARVVDIATRGGYGMAELETLLKRFVSILHRVSNVLYWQNKFNWRQEVEFNRTGEFRLGEVIHCGYGYHLVYMTDGQWVDSFWQVCTFPNCTLRSEIAAQALRLVTKAKTPHLPKGAMKYVNPAFS